MGSTRRELLAACLGGPVAAAACPREQSLDVDGAWVDPDIRRGHALRGEAHRGGREDGEVARTERSAEVVVLGAGIAGLSAAWWLRRSGVEDIAVLELEETPGGTALGEASPLGGHPWGAHYLPAPRRDQPALVELLAEMGLVEGSDAEGQPVYAEGALVAEPQERIFAAGLWQPGLVPEVGAAPGAAAAVRSFEARMAAFVGVVGEDGRRAFALPAASSSEDPRFLALDTMSFSEWLGRSGFSHPEVRFLADYATRDDFGARPDETSAWYGIHYHAARAPAPAAQSAPFLTWPDGNFHIVKHLSKSIEPRLFPGRLVTRVVPHPSGEGLFVEAEALGGRLERWRAARVVCALPGFVRERVLREMGRGASSLETSAWLVANLHLARRPSYVGTETAWDNVIRDSRALGYVVSTHQLGPPAGPTVWTWYLPLVDEAPGRARRRLLELDWRTAADLALTDLEVAHPDLRRCVTRVDVRRWGHAMPRPVPGTRASRALAAERTPTRGVHFAHADLSGVGLFEEAFHHGVRAAEEARRGV